MMDECPNCGALLIDGNRMVQGRCVECVAESDRVAWLEGAYAQIMVKSNKDGLRLWRQELPIRIFTLMVLLALGAFLAMQGHLGASMILLATAVWGCWYVLRQWVGYRCWIGASGSVAKPPRVL